MSPGSSARRPPRSRTGRLGHLRLVGGTPAAPRPEAATRRASVDPAGRLALVGWLCGVGLVMVLSASAYTSLQYYGSVWTIFERQVLWMGLGIIAFVLTVRVRYDRWRRLRIVLPLVTLSLLLAVLVPGWAWWRGVEPLDRVGPLRIQPSELMKLALAVFAADLLTRRADRLTTRGRGGPAPGAAGGLGRARVEATRHGHRPGARLHHLRPALRRRRAPAPVLKALGVTAVIGLIVGLAEPYRRARLLSFLDPFAHAKGSGYQVVQSLVGLGSGHLYGLGLGAAARSGACSPTPTPTSSSRSSAKRGA